MALDVAGNRLQHSKKIENAAARMLSRETATILTIANNTNNTKRKEKQKTYARYRLTATSTNTIQFTIFSLSLFLSSLLQRVLIVSMQRYKMPPADANNNNNNNYNNKISSNRIERNNNTGYRHHTQNDRINNFCIFDFICMSVVVADGDAVALV